MRTRVAILLLVPTVALLFLTGCSSDDEPGASSGNGSTRLGTPSDDLTEVTVPCADFEDTAQKITQAQTDLYAGTGDSAAIDTLVGELEGLKEGAPGEVQDALDALADGFQDAQELIEDPTPENKKALADVGAELSTAGQKVTAYVVAQCR